MPDNNAQQAAPEAQEAAAERPRRETPTQAGGQAPVMAARDWAVNKGNEASSLGDKFRTAVRNFLRFEEKQPEQTGIIKTPFYAAEHVIDGTALNVARRATEITEPQVESLAAGIRLTIGNILSPIQALLHPIQRILKPSVRAITGQIKAMVSTVLAPVRAADDLVDRSIENTVNQVNFQISRIPLLGSLFAKSTNFVTKIASGITGKIRETLEWMASPVDNLHAATA